MRKSSARCFTILALLAGLFFGAAVFPEQDLSINPRGLRWAARALKRMTVEEKVGQMIMIRANGRFLSADSEALRALESLVGELRVGGVVFFAGQVFETAWLANRLQKRAKTPLLMCSDFEQGAGFRVEGATAFPPLMAVGAADSEELAYQMGRITAVEGRAMGIHQALAPVADVNVNPLNPIINTRSVGEDPDQVGRLTRAFVRGCQQYGMIATAKHYPGHGDTDIDTHLDLAVLTADRDRLERVEFRPFRSLVDAGVLSIMSGHLAVPACDPTPGRPATLSPVLLTDWLRGRLNFRGLIVTDAMDMGGITTLFPPGEAAVLAVEAGADVVLLPADPREAARALSEAVRSGRIPEKRIDSSVRRMLALKARLGLHKDKYVDLERLPEIIGREDHRLWAARAFRESLTLVKNEGNVLPFGEEDRKIAVLSLSSDEGGTFAGRIFVREVLKRREDAVFGYAEAFTDRLKIAALAESARGADAILVALFSRLEDRKGTAGLNPGHAALVRELASSGKTMAVLSFGSPYFLGEFPAAACYVCAYRNSPEAQRTAAAAVFGEVGFSGRLPVSLPGLFPRGHGLVLPAGGVEER